MLGLVGEGCGDEERGTRGLGESWGARGEGVYGVLAPENVGTGHMSAGAKMLIDFSFPQA